MIKSCVAGVCLIGVAVLSWAAKKPSASDPRIEHGKYLVDKVALCGDCHTPHDEQGVPIPGKMLQGTALAFEPTVTVPVWAATAPGIAGLPRLSDADAVALFEQRRDDQRHPRPPAYAGLPSHKAGC